MKPVLVIGSLNMDLVARCERLPERGQTIMGSGFFTAPGGKGANQAVAAARLGAQVSMAGCVGNDAFGAELIAGLRGDGVDTTAIATAAAPTGTALITIDAAGSNTIVVISGANTACDAARAQAALARFPTPGILLLQHEIPAAANAAAIRAAHDAGWFVMLNPAPARDLPHDLLPHVDLLTPNQTEAAVLSGTPSAHRDTAHDAARRLQAMGARAVLITLGEAGALYCGPDAAWHCPAVAVTAMDTTAAGDAYVGALAAAFAEEQALEAALGFAAVAAGIAVTRLGAQPSLPVRAETDAFIARHGAPRAQRA